MDLSSMGSFTQVREAPVSSVVSSWVPKEAEELSPGLEKDPGNVPSHRHHLKDVISEEHSVRGIASRLSFKQRELVPLLVGLAFMVVVMLVFQCSLRLGIQKQRLNFTRHLSDLGDSPSFPPDMCNPMGMSDPVARTSTESWERAQGTLADIWEQGDNTGAQGQQDVSAQGTMRGVQPVQQPIPLSSWYVRYWLDSHTAGLLSTGVEESQHRHEHGSLSTAATIGTASISDSFTHSLTHAFSSSSSSTGSSVDKDLLAIQQLTFFEVSAAAAELAKTFSKPESSASRSSSSSSASGSSASGSSGASSSGSSESSGGEGRTKEANGWILSNFLPVGKSIPWQDRGGTRSQTPSTVPSFSGSPHHDSTGQRPSKPGMIQDSLSLGDSFMDEAPTTSPMIPDFLSSSDLSLPKTPRMTSSSPSHISDSSSSSSLRPPKTPRMTSSSSSTISDSSSSSSLRPPKTPRITSSSSSHISITSDSAAGTRPTSSPHPYGEDPSSMPFPPDSQSMSSPPTPDIVDEYSLVKLWSFFMSAGQGQSTSTSTPLLDTGSKRQRTKPWSVLKAKFPGKPRKKRKPRMQQIGSKGSPGMEGHAEPLK